MYWREKRKIQKLADLTKSLKSDGSENDKAAPKFATEWKISASMNVDSE